MAKTLSSRGVIMGSSVRFKLVGLFPCYVLILFNHGFELFIMHELNLGVNVTNLILL